MDSRVQFEIQGVESLMNRFMRMLTGVPSAAAGALYRQGEAIMTRSKDEFVPVDQGILKGTGHVSPPENKNGEIFVTLFYGGPAAPYAMIQHENLDFKHRIGEAKYLETPLMQAIPDLPRAIAADLADPFRGTA